MCLIYDYDAAMRIASQFRLKDIAILGTRTILELKL